ncbi:hypothetical protein [Nocardioides antri]|uniref:DUF4232 domain-containing protein n=1 Tax=Nocardioides antri TaxID=2607659 RepID=A0A5B1M6M7_9ACTN|nr:hypothetical protein [Nocardioides antri]KAA1428304.1 hypothetical protein F0U47_05065 [Nocardioides antri]
MPPLTRGPLPAGVYWRRRVFVLALAATLVFVIANWLGGGSDAEDDEVPAARQAGGRVDASETITVSEKDKKGRKDRRSSRGPQQGPTFDPSVLVEPEGNCEPADVRVTPQVEEAVAGQPVTIGLSLQTTQADACYFRIGSDKVSLKIMKGGREVWTSRECPDPVPEESVVVRRVVATLVEMTWDARESTPDCTRRDWLFDGDYTVVAAALGGEPAESDFELVSPTPETVTVAPEPEQDRKGERGDRQGEQDAEQDDEQQPSDTESSAPPRR